MPSGHASPEVSEFREASSDESGTPVAGQGFDLEGNHTVQAESESADQLPTTSDAIITDLASETDPADALISETMVSSDVFNLFTETRYQTKLTDWWILLMDSDVRSQIEMATAATDVE
jgi:hypothetical protein